MTTVLIVAGLCLGALLGWTLYNRGSTRHPLMRRAAPHAGHSTPLIPAWFHGWIARIIWVAGTIALIAITNFLVYFFFGISIYDTVEDFWGTSGGKTLWKTLAHPLPIAIITAAIIALTWFWGGKKWAVALSIAAIAIAAMYFFVPVNCWSKDTECVANQQKVKAQEAMERQLKNQQQSASLFNGNPCTGTITRITFTTTPMHLDPHARCAVDLAFEGHCVYVWQAGKTETKDAHKLCWLQGGTPPAQPSDVVWVAAVDKPFEGAYRLMPPRYTSTFR